MKILVLSDSHGDTGAMVKVWRKIGRDIDAVLHLGDFASDLSILNLEGRQWYAVLGNSDGMGQGWAGGRTSAAGQPSAGGQPLARTLCLGGKTFFITHGHLYGVKNGVKTLLGAAAQAGADVCLFGHTHLPEIFYQGPLLCMNPGSIGRPRPGSAPSYGVVDLAEGTARPALMAL
jgi:putative phosphoesterase